MNMKNKTLIGVGCVAAAIAMFGIGFGTARATERPQRMPMEERMEQRYEREERMDEFMEGPMEEMDKGMDRMIERVQEDYDSLDDDAKKTVQSVLGLKAADFTDIDEEKLETIMEKIEDLDEEDFEKLEDAGFLKAPGKATRLKAPESSTETTEEKE